MRSRRVENRLFFCVIMRTIMLIRAKSCPRIRQLIRVAHHVKNIAKNLNYVKLLFKVLFQRTLDKFFSKVTGVLPKRNV